MGPKPNNEPASVDETNADQTLENLGSPGDAPAIEHAELTELDELEAELEPEPPRIAFELAGDVTAFRHTVGGNEISLDKGDQYLTNDAREIAQLDAHDAVRRCEEPA